LIVIVSRKTMNPYVFESQNRVSKSSFVGG
jgi:hypothetical protein